MASTYTSNTGLEKPGTGEQVGTWGNTANENYDIIDRLVSGVGTITLSGTTHTLTTTDGALSDGQYKVLVFGGSPSGTNTVTLSPSDQSKAYWVHNASGQTVVITQGSGGDVTLSNGTGTLIYADGGGAGAAVVDFLSLFSRALTDFGVAATAGELNVLDGITASTAELNILDGVTATAAQLNYSDITALGTSEASKVVTADANGNVKLAEELQATAYIETLVTLTGTTPTVDCDEANSFALTTSGNTTFTFDYSGVNLTTNDTYGFTLKVTAGGSHSLTWPASVDWPSGGVPSSPASGETSVYVFYTFDGGTTWYGRQAGAAFA